MHKATSTSVAVVLFGLVLFLTGQIISRNLLQNRDSNNALVGNSLVARFDKTEEKKSEPIGIFQLSKSAAAYPVLASGGKELLYYNPDNGEIRSIAINNLAGNAALLAKLPAGAEGIGWSNRRTLIASYAKEHIYYELATGYSKKLDPRIKNPVLSPNGKMMAFNYYDDKLENGHIGVSAPDHVSGKTLVLTRSSDWKIGWLSEDSLYLIKPSTFSNQVSLFTLDAESGALERIIDSARWPDALWASSGDKFVYNNDGLNFMSLTDKKRVTLDQHINAAQCVWGADNATVYCVDGKSIVSINTATPGHGPQKLPVNGDMSPLEHASHLTLTSTENYLFFVAAPSSTLYAVRIND